MRLVLISLFVKLHLIFGLKILLNVTKKLEIVYFQDIMDNLAQGGGLNCPFLGWGLIYLLLLLPSGQTPPDPTKTYDSLTSVSVIIVYQANPRGKPLADPTKNLYQIIIICLLSLLDCRLQK